jgi:hypothetical protein
MVTQLGSSLASHKIDSKAPDAKEQEEARRTWERRVEIARAPAGKYFNTALVVIWTVLVNLVMFFLSVLATIHFLRETRRAASWTQRTGLMVLLLIVVLVLGNIALFSVGLSHNPVAWLTVILGKYVGVATILALVLASNVFSWWLSDPWLGGMMVAPLLPVFALALLVVPALISDCSERARHGAQKLVLQKLVAWLGPRRVSLLMTVLVLVAIIVAQGVVLPS